MKTFDFKKVIPHLVAIAIFYAVTLIYFAPIFMENKDLVQGDVKSYIGWGDDVRKHYESTGEMAYWSNAMFGGMPSNLAYPPTTNNIFDKIDDIAMGFLPPNTAGVFFAYMLGFYLFLLAIGASSWLSIIGAIAYALCSYNLIIIDAGHVSKALVMATIAPVIGGVILCYRKKYISGILLTLIATGLNIVWNHQQISFYLIITLSLLAIAYFVDAIRKHTVGDFFKSSAVLIVIALLAVAPAVDKLLPTLDYSKETMRGGPVLQTNPNGEKETSGLDIEYAYQWSYGKAETMTLLIPNFYGASSHYNIGKESATYEALKPTGQANQIVKQAPMYWGDQPFTSGPVYLGAIICFLFLFGMIICKGADRWWILAATIVTIILSWGRNMPVVNEWLFYHLPLYNKFRTPSMSLVIPSVLMVGLAIMSLHEVIIRENKKTLLKPLCVSFGIVGGISLFFALFGGTLFDFKSQQDAQFPEWLHGALISDRISMLKSDAWRSLIYIALAASVLYIYITTKIEQKYLYIAIGLLIVVDLWSVDKRFLNDDNFISNRTSKTIEATEIDKMIKQDTDPDYRVLNLTTNTFNESYTSYHHKSIGGYSPAKLRRYQDLIDYHISTKITPNVLNMLNTKYIIVNTQQGPRVQQNPDAIGHAWFVENIKWNKTPDEEIEALYDVDIHNTALIEESWREKIADESALVGRDSLATIELTDYRNPGNLIYTTSGSKSNLALFSEVYYKTWKVYIDGKEAPLMRANYILRAVEVPAGTHTLEFKCVDTVYETTHKWSLIASILVGLVMSFTLGFGIYKGLKEDTIIKKI